jgi:16S rRNA (uracil1498-N3)-methyltransferase
LNRVYVDAALARGAVVNLSASAAGHVTRVLRLRAGEPLTLFNGLGGEYAGTIEQARGGAVTVAVGEARGVERESPLALTLAQGISRGERMDLVVQKATELGVFAIAPLLTERSVVRLTAQQADRKLNHWRAIAVGACEQSGRNRLPQLSPPRAVTDYLRDLRDGATASAEARLILRPDAEGGVAALRGPLARITVLVGPEGGLTAEEEAAARAAGFKSVRLGPRVLRTETAALAALALLQREFGDL